MLPALLPVPFIKTLVVFVVNPPANIVEPVTDKFDANCVLLFKPMPFVAAMFTLTDVLSPGVAYAILIAPTFPPAFDTFIPLLVIPVVICESNTPSVLWFLNTILPGAPGIIGELSSSNIILAFLKGDTLLCKISNPLPEYSCENAPLILVIPVCEFPPINKFPLIWVVPIFPALRRTLPVTVNPLPTEALPSALKSWLRLILPFTPNTLSWLLSVVAPSTCKVCVNTADEPEICPNACNVPLVNTLPLVPSIINLPLPILSCSWASKYLILEVFTNEPPWVNTNPLSAADGFQDGFKLAKAPLTPNIVPADDDKLPTNIIPVVPLT